MLSLTSCQHDSKKTFISSTKSEWYDRVYDDKNNLIYYIPTDQNFQNPMEVIILDLNNMTYTRKGIKYEY